MIKNLSSILIVYCTGWFSTGHAENLQRQTYGAMEDQVTSAFIREMWRDLRLTPTSRGGSMPEDVETISISFDSRQSVGINEARRISVLAIDRLCRKVDAYRELRPYLRKYPFPSAGAEILLSFPKDPQRNPEDGVYTIFHVNGMLYYYRYADEKLAARPSFYEEPYEQALAIIQKKYPADFSSSQKEAKPEISLSFTDIRDLPFDKTAEAKKTEMEQAFPAPITELNELAVLGLQAMHSKDLSAILRDLTRDIVAPYFDEAFLQRVHDFQQKHPNGEYLEYWGNGQMKFQGYL